MTPLIRLAARVLDPISFRGKARLLHAICPRNGEHEARIFGFDISLDLEDYIQRSIFLGTFEPCETRLFASRLRRGMTVIDVGANVGYYSLLAASRVGHNGVVYAFEPSPYAVDRLATTVRRNGIDQIVVVNAGLSDLSGSVDLFLPATPGNHTPTMVPHGSGHPVRVSVSTLDLFCAEREVARIDLLKIDVEGLEPNVIRGADALLRERRIGGILCEFNTVWLAEQGTNSDELYSLIRGYGYRESGTRYRGDIQLQNLVFEPDSGQ